MCRKVVALSRLKLFFNGQSEKDSQVGIEKCAGDELLPLVSA
jgi:hypothetical protein